MARVKFKNTLSATVLKAMSFFTGVQAIQILCSIIRAKFVAVWIGPTGVGLIALYNNLMEMISTTSQLNLRQSAVRDIAGDNRTRLPMTVHAVQVWALLLGFGGMIATCALSPLLSLWQFATIERWWVFCLLSVMVPLSAISSAKMAIMQGRNMLGRLAMATMWGAVVATALSLPLYIFLGEAGIVPSLILFAVSTAVSSTILCRKVLREIGRVVRATWHDVWAAGKGFLSLGIYMTVSMSLTLLASYVFVLYLNHFHGTSAVGLYQAGYTLITNYVGVIFIALAMEYYPRLVSVAKRKYVCSVTVSHEMSVILWAAMPAIMLFVGIDRWLMILLYSDAFLDVLPYVTIAVTGMVFRAVSYCLAYTILARGDGGIYVVTESISVVIGLALNIISYTLWGYEGLGVAFVLWYLIYTVIVGVVYRCIYGMRLRGGMIWLIVLSCVVALSALMLKSIAWWVPAVLSIPLALLSAKRIMRR